MAYSTPTATGNRAYQLNVQSVQPVGDYYVHITCTATTDDMNSDVLASIFQKFVDLVASSPDFIIPSAVRSQEYTEIVTPTA